VVFVLAHVAPAAADIAFTGECNQVKGFANLAKALTSSPRDNTYSFFGSGSCSGTLNGEAIAATPISITLQGGGMLSCASTASGSPGTGSITFTRGTADPKDDVILPFTLKFTGTATELKLDLVGLTAGTATGRASFLNDLTSPLSLATCAGIANPQLPFNASAKGTLVAPDGVKAALPLPGVSLPAVNVTAGTPAKPGAATGWPPAGLRPSNLLADLNGIAVGVHQTVAVPPGGKGHDGAKAAPKSSGKAGAKAKGKGRKAGAKAGAKGKADVKGRSKPDAKPRGKAKAKPRANSKRRR
jgi:hypothetical protein